MKILVPIKRVIDPYVKVRWSADQTHLEENNTKMVINPFDEVALEQALRLKEKQQASEVIVATIDNEKGTEILRTALALGADRAIHIRTDNQNLFPLSIAQLLACLIPKENIKLVLMGKQAIDNDCNQTGQMLAALLNWPQATFACSIEINGDHALVSRAIEEGEQKLKLNLPAVISVDLHLNTPRFAKLIDIMRAKNKPINTYEAESFSIPLTANQKIIRLQPPSVKSMGKLTNNLEEFLNIFNNVLKSLD